MNIQTKKGMQITTSYKMGPLSRLWSFGRVVIGLLLMALCKARLEAQVKDMYGKAVKEDLINTSMSYLSDSEVNQLITKIMETYSLPNRYITRSAPGIGNALARIDQSGSRVIYYDPNFLKKVKSFSFTGSDLPTEMEDWGVLLVLAHEVGHHLCQHLTNPHPDMKQREMELEADEKAGYILYILNAPDLETAQAGLKVPEVGEEGDYTHPPRQQRLEAFKKGWEDAARRYPRSVAIAPSVEDHGPMVGKMILIKGGTFEMGCTGEQEGCDSDEKPAHRVTLGDYYIGETEVTQAQWRAVMRHNPSANNGCDQCPVDRVSWNDIQDFLTRLNEGSGGLKYRLPTEAEWEYAARGGKRGYRYAGSNNLGEVGWYGSNSGRNTHPVKGKRPNELGLYDMSGNVGEWCSDRYKRYSSSAKTNPVGAARGSDRVNRGGSCYDSPADCRVARRNYNAPDDRSSGLGFRLARTF